MIIAFTGHRNKLVQMEFLDDLPQNALWVHGGASGFDAQVENYAKLHGITTNIIRPDYDKFGKAAPTIRNRQILIGADLLVACYDGRKYGGTFYTIRLAEKLGLPIRFASIQE